MRGGIANNADVRLAVRSRWQMVLVLGLVIAIGIASRKVSFPLPRLVQKELGDVLWAAAANFALACIWPAAGIAHLALVATALAMLSECSQISRAGWLEQLRGYSIGR